MISSMMLYAMDYVDRYCSPVSGLQLVLLVLSFSNGEINFRIKDPCFLYRYGPIPSMRLWAS